MYQDGFEFIIDHEGERAYMYVRSGSYITGQQRVGFEYAKRMMRNGKQVANKPTTYREIES